jgi:hypothetical protein
MSGLIQCKRMLTAGLAMLVCSALSVSDAAVVTWRLDGVQFDGGQTGTGWFTYDASHLALITWDIETEGSGNFMQSTPPSTCNQSLPVFRCDLASVSPGKFPGTIVCDSKESPGSAHPAL